MTRVDWRNVKSHPLTPEQVAVKLFDAAKLKATARKLEFNLSFNDVYDRVKKRPV